MTSAAHTAPVRLLVLVLLSCCVSCSGGKRVFKCPSGCTCTTETIICVGSSFIPRTVPADISSLSIVNGTFPEIREATFALMPSLHLLLLNSNSISCIKDDAFSGLPRLEYL
ncbi:leucine-rich repeat LGI family member 2b [Tachysurus ichikawai]